MKKSLLKLFVLVFTFLFLSCQTEEIFVEKKHFGKKSKIETRYLNGNEAIRVKNLLNTKLNSGSKLKIFASNSNSMRTSEGTIDFNTILQVIDSLGIKNYTFRIINHPDDDEKTFHNLVLTEKENELEATIMKYEMDALFAQEYHSGIKEFEEFQGRISALSLSPADPCEQVTITYPSNGSGTGDGGTPSDGPPSDGPIGSPGDSGGGDGGCVSISLSFECSCGNSFNSYSGALGCASLGTGNYTITIVINYLTLSTCRTSEDPCNPDGTIGVIEPPVSVPDMIEDKIDDSELDPCTKGILDKLKNLQQNDLSKIFERFDNPIADFEVNFSQVPNLVDPTTNEAVYGLFHPTNENYVYDIKLNSNNFNNNGATNLGKAKVIVHELIHALIASVIQHQGANQPGSTMQNFPLIWNSYVNITTGSSAPEDHTFMGKHYVKIIASILQEYDTGVPVQDNVEPEQLYKDLAWSGIWYPGNNNFDSELTGEDKARIYSRNLAEMTNSYSNGVNPTNNPPCLN